jgi:NADPH:quinone reductase-like Zn-dependent oxidoreductase
MVKVLGVDSNQVLSLIFNIASWFMSFFITGSIEYDESKVKGHRCISVIGQGGLEKLTLKELSVNEASVGYNVSPFRSPIAVLPSNLQELDPSLVIVNVHFFSINYADISIRFGLYESALRFIGFPITPGFDLAGTVEYAGKASGFSKGDKVFGFSLFGAYSSRVLVPYWQLKKVSPKMQDLKLQLQDLAGVPAVAATALHAVQLAGGWPSPLRTNGKAALIHSAAGGVGSMLIQIASLCGYSPIVCVVGSKHKIDFCKKLGAQLVIDKSSDNLWKKCEEIAPLGFAAVFDANGVSTLHESYNHLAPCGRLITYGFHTNLPKDSSYLDPVSWIGMIFKMSKMPKYDPMDMVVSNKAVLGFNLSFLANELDMIEAYMSQIVTWLEDGKLVIPSVTLIPMRETRKAHSLIQSGKTTGKLVVSVPDTKID